MKFLGTYSDLQGVLAPLSLEGNWEEHPNGVKTFRCRNRSGMNWSESKGTVWFDGPASEKAALQMAVETALGGEMTPRMKTEGSIFVVHGRDHESRDQLELVLRRLGLEPYVLQLTGGGGETLIEVLERMIGKSAECTFGIVLVTPDDMGYLKTEQQEAAQPRARQNVVMEMGMLLASLTRKHCAILQKGFVEMPSNMGGIITLGFNDHVKEAVPKLVQRLQDAGFDLDAGAIGRAQA